MIRCRSPGQARGRRGGASGPWVGGAGSIAGVRADVDWSVHHRSLVC